MRILLVWKINEYYVILSHWTQGVSVIMELNNRPFYEKQKQV
jgi:hypothetical protein